MIIIINISLLKNMSNIKSFDRGAILIEEGALTGNEMFILLKGSVGVFKNYNTHNELKIATLNEGDFFGEMTLFLNINRTATVVALKNVIAIIIDRINAYDFFEKEPAVTYAIIKALCARLNNLNNLYEGANSNIDYKKDIIIKHRYSLFPEGHQEYTLPTTGNEEYIYNKEDTCPICRHKFTIQTIPKRMLKPEYTTNEFRIHYKNNMEPLYYDIITCTNCWYSAGSNIFKEANVTRDKLLNKNLRVYKAEMDIQFSMLPDAFTLFAKYYLAIIATSICFSDYKIHVAELWLKISWLYHDCNDYKMELLAAKKAQKTYLEVYKNKDLKDDSIQIHALIGELSYKVNDLENAKYFYQQVNKSKKSTNELRLQSEKRLHEIGNSNITC